MRDVKSFGVEFFAVIKVVLVILLEMFSFLVMIVKEGTKNLS